MIKKINITMMHY